MNIIVKKVITGSGSQEQIAAPVVGLPIAPGAAVVSVTWPDNADEVYVSFTSLSLGLAFTVKLWENGFVGDIGFGDVIARAYGPSGYDRSEYSLRFAAPMQQLISPPTISDLGGGACEISSGTGYGNGLYYRVNGGAWTVYSGQFVAGFGSSVEAFEMGTESYWSSDASSLQLSYE